MTRPHLLGDRRLASVLRFALAGSAFGVIALSAKVARATPPDEVFLVEGGRVRGTIMEDDPQKGVSIQLLDGTTQRLTRSSVLRVQYALGPAAPPLPILPASPVAPLDAPSFAPPPFTGPRRGHHITALWVTGLSVWSVMYLSTIALAGTFAQDHDKAKAVGEAAVPFAGPFIGLADGGHDLKDSERAGIITSAVVQQVGLAMFIMGATVRVGGDARPVAITPLPVASGSGAALTWRF